MIMRKKVIFLILYFIHIHIFIAGGNARCCKPSLFGQMFLWIWIWILIDSLKEFGKARAKKTKLKNDGSCK